MTDKPLSEKATFIVYDEKHISVSDVAEAVEKLKEEIKEETWFPTRKLQIERIDKIFGSFK